MCVVTLKGTLYEIRNFASFVQTYVMESRRPDPDSIRSIKNGRIRLCRGEGPGSASPLPPQCRTDKTGRFELDLSQVPDGPVFVVAAGSKELRDNYWYRSKSVRSAALGQHQRDIYVARVTIPDELGFSQADLAELLEQMKEQVADLERITGRITGGGIALSGSGKGATASFKILLEPDRSDDLGTLMRHALTNFRLDLPGPAWLTGLLVSQGRSRRIDPRRCAELLSIRSTNGCDSAPSRVSRTRWRKPTRTLAAILTNTATLTLERLRYPLCPIKAEQAATIEQLSVMCAWGFPRFSKSKDFLQDDQC